MTKKMQILDRRSLDTRYNRSVYDRKFNSLLMQKLLSIKAAKINTALVKFNLFCQANYINEKLLALGELEEFLV